MASTSASLPTGTVTFLFTDVEGSTRLWEQHPDQTRAALVRHDALIEQLTEWHDGVVVRPRGEGDSRFCVFPRATDAVRAAAAIQQALTEEPWPQETPIRVRLGLHTGEADLRDGDYYGSAVNRAARLRAAAHGGQTLLSQATFDLVRDALPADTTLRDLGEHRLKDLARPERVWQLAGSGVPSDFPSLRTLDTLPNNLPLQLTSFVGREKEMAEVNRHLSVARLLTLTGPGGTGKTRLSLQVAADALEDYPDGVFFVELAPIGDPTQVLPAVAGALSIQEEPGVGLMSTLTAALKNKHLLLVLDNCEHVLSACAALVDALLRACPKLQILTSSREPLGIAGETSWRVPSLALPLPNALPPLGALTQYEAVRLFIDRARATLPSFAVTEANAPAVAQICHRLDGIPLAIELAAARVKLLSAEQLLARLEDRFRLLTGGSRTALPRQQTLQALVDWSYGLLSAEEKALFSRLSVFYGGFTLEAAERVCAGTGAGGAVDEFAVLDLLGHLVDKSLVTADDQAGGHHRYRLLETLRQYARNKLVDSGDSEAVHHRHAAYFLELAEAVRPRLTGTEQPALLDQLEREHDNFRAALRWLTDRGQAGEREATRCALELVGALWRFWYVRGYLVEGREHAERALALPGAGERTPGRGAALRTAASLALEHGDISLAAYARESLAIARECGDPHAVFAAANIVSLYDYRQGDDEASQQHLEEALAAARALGDVGSIGNVLGNLSGIARRRRDEAEARRLMGEAIDHLRRAGNPALLGNFLSMLAGFSWRDGDYARARVVAEEAVATLRAAGSRTRLISGLVMLGTVKFDQGDVTAARAHAAEALAIARQHGFQLQTIGPLRLLAELALEDGSLSEAATVTSEALTVLLERHRANPSDKFTSRSIPGMVIWLSAALAARGDNPRRTLRLAGAATRIAAGGSGSRVSPAMAARRERWLEPARAALTWEEAAAAWAEGEAMSPEEAIHDALNGLPTLEPAPL